MKRFVSVTVLLLIGILCGWIGRTCWDYLVCYHHLKVEAPEFIRLNSDVNDILKGMTKEDAKETIAMIRQDANKNVQELQVTRLAQAMLAIRLQNKLRHGGINEASTYLEDRISVFLKAYDEGQYENSYEKDLAAAIVKGIRNTTDTNNTSKHIP